MNKHSKLIIIIIFVTYHFSFVFCQFNSKPRMIYRARKSGTWLKSLQPPKISTDAELNDLLVNPDGPRAEQVVVEPRSRSKHRFPKDIQSKASKKKSSKLRNSNKKHGKRTLCAEQCATPECSVTCQGAKGLVACKARKCKSLAIGENSASLCAGVLCQSQCYEMDCMATCEGPNCNATCSGKNCIVAGKGEESSGMCNMTHCVSAVTGPRTISQCEGKSCKANCAGVECVAKCSGENCIAVCQGTNCMSSCAGNDCKFFIVNGGQHSGVRGVSTENLDLSFELDKPNVTHDHGELKTKGVIGISGLHDTYVDKNKNGGIDTDVDDNLKLKYDVDVKLSEKVEEYVNKKINRLNDMSVLGFIPKFVG